MFQKNSACLYTGLFGGYEELNELDGDARNSKIKRICLTDNESLTSETWEVRVIKPAFPLDSVRSQREVKIKPHKFLPEFTSSIYIDNTVKLKVDPLKLIDLYCDKNDVTFAMHSYRDSVYEEFFAVIDSGLDDSSRIFEQLNHYQVICPTSLSRKPYWGGLIIRNHMKADVIDLMDTWYGQILRYSRRDQLSLVYAELHAGVNINQVNIDINESEFHQWPINSKRDSKVRAWSPSLSGSMSIFESIKGLKDYEKEIKEKKENLKLMNENVLDKINPVSVPEGFDPEVYLTLNKDVATAGVDPSQHYISHGWREGRRWR